ncbi:MAG: SPOR domain-containing protein [Tannerellaceae bacterium]|nr:SPOR domain-containing protein [Tannerellaceae bacterium]
MVRLTNHLEFLLAEHDCVVIPGIGGFVMRTLPSVYNKEEHSFSPMRKEIVFNHELTHTDGLLVASYARIYGKVFEEAQVMVEEDVAELTATLDQHGKVSLGTIGTLARGEEGKLIFTAGSEETSGTDVYGLPSFSIPVLPPEDSQEVHSPQKKEAVHVKKNKWWGYAIAVAATVIGLIWYTTFPENALFEKQQEGTAIPAVSEELPILEEVPALREAKKEVISADKKAELEALEAKVKKEVTSEVKKGKYYVVIGSFPGEKKALSALKAYKRRSGGKTANAGILHRDGRYRVYEGNYTTRTDAKAALARIRRNERHKDAWILIDKQ